MTDLKDLIQKGISKNASDIHMGLGTPAIYRVDGKLEASGFEPLTEEDLSAAVNYLANPSQLKELESVGESDFAVTFENIVRMRCNIFKERGQNALALRLLPMKIPTAKELKVPGVVVEQADKKRGLVLVTGPTGSGKSSTLAALLEHINERRSLHIITLEAPIEYIHTPKKCIINQREVGKDTQSFAAGLRAALRQDPDVILVGEMRDLETISTAITAAETGHLVFGTLHTKGAANTVDRIVDAFPPNQQEQIRMQLADVLECVIGQTLLPATYGGRRAAFEVLLGTPAVKNMIRQLKTFQIESVMQTSRSSGMITLDAALASLLERKEIYPEDAMAAANNPGLLFSEGRAGRS